MEKKNTTEKNEITTVKNDGVFAITTPNENSKSELRFTTTTDNIDLFNIMTGKSENIKSIIDKGAIEVVNIAVTTADVNSDKNDENSEIVRRPVVHFLTKDGKHYSTMSNGVIRNASALIETGIIPTVESPLKIEFTTVETKFGTAHTFNLVK